MRAAAGIPAPAPHSFWRRQPGPREVQLTNSTGSELASAHHHGGNFFHKSWEQSWIQPHPYHTVSLQGRAQLQADKHSSYRREPSLHGATEHLHTLLPSSPGDGTLATRQPASALHPTGAAEVLQAPAWPRKQNSHIPAALCS